MINLTPRMDATFLDADPIFESYTVPVPGSGFVEKKNFKKAGFGSVSLGRHKLLRSKAMYTL